MISSFTLVIVYLVCTFFIGNVLTKRSQTVHSYFIAKDQLGTGLIMVLVFSELISGSSTVGNASQAYSLGISSVWEPIWDPFGAPWSAWPYWRRFYPLRPAICW